MQSTFQRFPLSTWKQRGENHYTSEYNPHHMYWVKHKDSVAAGIFFAQGRIDNWAVYIILPTVDSATGDCIIEEYRPGDSWLLEQMSMYSKRVDRKYLTKYFMDTAEFVYNMVYFEYNGAYSEKAIDGIRRYIRSWCDAEDTAELDIVFCTLYYMMIAEENKQKSVIGGLLKLNAIYEVLMLGHEIEETCSRYVGHSASEIAEVAKTYGFCR